MFGICWMEAILEISITAIPTDSLHLLTTTDVLLYSEKIVGDHPIFCRVSAAKRQIFQ